MGNRRRQYGKKDSGTTDHSGFISSDFLRAAAYHPTNAQPTTPIIGQRLTPDNRYHYQNAVPGVYWARYLPVFASNDSMPDNSTMRNVSRNMWSSLRNFCTTAVGYQPGDVMNTMLQCGQIPAMLTNIKRRMASAFMADVTYNLYNREVYFILNPGATELQRRSDIADMSRFVARYNSIVQLYNSIACPDKFPIFHRWEFLNNEIFTDVDLDAPNGSKFAQYLIFEPQCWYKTKLADPSIPGTQMVPYSIAQGIDGALTQLEDLLNTMFEDTSFRQILGDLRNTFGDDHLYQMNTITLEDVHDNFKPTYNMEVLYTLHNATILPIQSPTINVNVNTGALEGVYSFYSTLSPRSINSFAAFVETPKLFNAQKWGVTTDEFIKYTAWTIQQEAYSPTGGILEPGPELITKLSVWGYDYPMGTRQLMEHQLETFRWYAEAETSITMANALEIAGMMGAISSFAYHPIYYSAALTFDSSDAVTAFKYISYGAELEIPVFLDTQDLASWHDAVREGLWGLPIDIEFKMR